MRSKSSIKYTPAAVDDMDEVFSYISQDNVSAADELLERIRWRNSLIWDQCCRKMSIRSYSADIDLLSYLRI